MKDAQHIIRSLASRFARLDHCSALAISGSKTSPVNDDMSDWDLYIYSTRRITPDERKAVLEDMFDSIRVDMSFFEEGDEAVRDGIAFDLMYRDTSFVEEQIDRVWRRHCTSLGYTTCFLYNLKTSRFIFDKTGLAGLVAELDGPYPDELAQRIIEDNARMTSGDGEATWMKQISWAERRGDIVSRNHRLAALMASYFDMLFAFNRVLHPGEKKLMKYAHLLCHRLPESFDEDIDRVYRTMYEGDLTGALTTLLGHLYDMIGITSRT